MTAAALLPTLPSSPLRPSPEIPTPMQTVDHEACLPTTEQWGAALQALRESGGYSRIQFAVAAGLGVGSLERVEQGKQPPSLRTLILLCGVMEVSLDWLLDEALKA